MFIQDSRSYASEESDTVSVVATAGGTQLLPQATSARNLLTITNCDAGASMYIGIGFTPTSSLFTIKLGPETVFGFDVTVPQDKIIALSSSGTISAKVYSGA